MKVSSSKLINNFLTYFVTYNFLTTFISNYVPQFQTNISILIERDQETLPENLKRRHLTLPITSFTRVYQQFCESYSQDLPVAVSQCVPNIFH